MATIRDAKTLYGLIGYPIRHSFSAIYFNAKFEDEGIDAYYNNFELEDVGDLMEIIAEYPNLNGLNVTSPYKELIIPYMNELDELARATGAVNVIKFVHGDKDNELRLVGYNSDVTGFELSIKKMLTPERDAALVLGTGGAAKAVTMALERLGVTVHAVSRRKSARTFTYEELTRQMIAEHKIIVNATPVGSLPNVEECPDLPYRFLTPGHLCYDLVYNPSETKFMRLAAAQGAQVKNGLEMLLLQAFRSYEIWNS